MFSKIVDLLDRKTGRVTDPLLVTCIILFLGVIGVIGWVVTKLEFNTGSSIGSSIAILAALVVFVVALVVVVLYLLRIYRDKGESAEAHELQRRILELENNEASLREELSRAARVIDRNEYAQILQEWNAVGPGHVLLYNIEMQSFANPDLIAKTWGGLARLENIQSVVLLLPPKKVERWQNVVVREEMRFLKDKSNHKFQVCAIDAGDGSREIDAPRGVAFALYRLGPTAGDGKIHQKAVVFVLSKPFSELRPAMVPGDDEWWDYHHILAFDGDETVIKSAEFIWRRNFVQERTRTVERVLADAKPLVPIEPEELFDGLGVEESRRTELMQQLTARKMVSPSPKRIPMDEPTGEFTLSYDNLETVQGHYSGIDIDSREPKQSLVWVGGFSERRSTKLAELFERTLKKEAVVQYYYEVSPVIEFVTMTRYMEDMREVLRYVNGQHKVTVTDQIVLIARSINGFLAALVAAEDEFLDMLSGVILVAPVFDIIEMMDNYRAARGQADVRVENCWRCSPGYTAHAWEDPQRGWLEFFEHQVSLALPADIIRNAPDTFTLDAFKRGIGIISQRCPVYILSSKEDPITGSGRAFEVLKSASSGTGLIREENYTFIETESSHLPPDQIDKDLYPFAMRNEIARVHEMLGDILKRLNVPTINEEPTQ